MTIRTLYLTRHADALPTASGASDFERRLSAFGRSQVEEIGRRLKTRGVLPDLILSSEAFRALETAQGLAEKIGYPRANLHTDGVLYEATPRLLLDLVNEIDDKIMELMIVAHNPTISSMVAYVTQQTVEHLPTCAVAKITIESERWAFVALGSGVLEWCETP